MIESTLDIFLRLGGATLAGSVIGINRELRRKPAGLRTHALVSLGSALVVVTTLRLAGIEAENSVAVTRSIQGIVAGVGFLGGGVILKTRESESVTGLTTAASIWLVAAIGIGCGAADWISVSATLFFALAVLILGGSFENWLKRMFPDNRRKIAVSQGGVTETEGRSSQQ